MMIRIAIFLAMTLAAPSLLATNYVCGQDLNGDGEINKDGEYAECKTKNVQVQSIPSESCRDGFTINGGRCEKTTITNSTPVCSSGTFDAITQQCKNTVTAIKLAQCPVDSTAKPNGTCIIYSYANLIPKCDAGWYFLNGECRKDNTAPPITICPSGYTFSSEWGTCRSAPALYPSSTWTSCNVFPSGTAKEDGYHCRFIGTGMVVWSNHYQLAASSLSCPAGVLSGNMCILPPFTTGAAWVCPSGFNKIGDVCIKENVVPHNYACPAGMTDNGTDCTRIDYTPASWTCPAEYKKSGDQCYLTEYDNIIYSCQNGHTLNYNTPRCEIGYKYSLTHNMCRKYTSTSPSLIGNCFDTPSATAQEDAFFKLWQGTSCTLWSSKYQTSPVQGGPSCVSQKPETYCPINVNQSCLNNNGGSECSPNKCIDIDIEKPIDDGSITGDMLVNDGEKNSDGLCLDQMFIFNGRAQDCKMPGASNAFKDCCKSEGKALSDDAGSLMSASQTMSAVSNVYSAATEAYTAYNAAIQAGQTTAAAMNSGIAAAQNYMMVAFDPTSLAISIAVYVVMKYLATACDQQSMETALMSDSGFCHHIGTYCKKRIKFLGCVQKAQAYCCFNSKLARIIHEQGRPQLKTGINNWGTPESPLCRGFTPEEFESIDFGKIDLSEYINEIQKTATDEIQRNMSTVTNDFLQQVN